MATPAPLDVVQIRLLGPIEAVGPTGRAAFAGSRQPALLGLLALRAPEVVPCYRLIEGLWGERPPRTALKTLHSHIARLRQVLEACGVRDALHTRDPGYALRTPPAVIDVAEFEREVAAARGDLADGASDAAAARLRVALAWWRGDAFADAEPVGWAAAEVTRLHDMRVAALEDLWDAELRLGRHDAATGELERLRAAHPLRERLVGLSMLALYRCGRSTDALAVYRRLRHDLVEDLGVEPGPHLDELHTQILRRDPALDPPHRPLSVQPLPELPTPAQSAPAQSSPAQRRAQPPDPPAATPPAPPISPPLLRPAELPATVNHFTGRDAELDALDRLAVAGDARVLVIAGAAGIGKTALAVHWGHTRGSRFPDGQIFLDLRGHDPAMARPAADALAHVLSALEPPDPRLPAGVPDRSARYRSLTADRRVLVVADNAHDVDQILPLVPSGPGTLLVVTARGRLDALSTHHATGAVDLDVLPADDALRLLGAVLGAERVRGQRADATRLVRLCDGMPLALQIAAAKLAARPRRRLVELAEELATGDRLDELAVDGDSRSVRAAFATAYHALSVPAARAFRLMGLHPGVTWTAHLTAAATDAPLPAAQRAMEEIAAAHLAVEVGDGRYRFHDLIRLYAAERAAADEAPGAIEEATARVQDWYLAVAAAANRIVDPGRDRIVPRLGRRPAALPFTADPQAALAFLDGERDNLAPVMGHALARGRPELAWQMTYLLTGFFDSRGHWAQRVRMCRLGVEAALAAGDPAAEGLMRSGLGVAHLMTGQIDDALDELGRALVLTRAHGDRRGQAHVLNNIAAAHAGARRFGRAVEAYQRALALHAAQASALGVALAHNNMGDAYVRMGRADLGVEHLTEALAGSRAIGNARLEAAALSGLGQAYRERGEHGLAVRFFEQALALRRRAGDRRYEADTLNNLGRVESARGDDEAARAAFTQALAISREIVDPHQESMAWAGLGHLGLRRRDLDEAGDCFHRALAAREAAPDPVEAAAIHRGLAELARQSGEPRQARSRRT